MSSSTMRIRPAAEGDLPEIQSIYAHHVLTGTGTFEEEPPSLEEMAARFGKVADHGLAWLVATDSTGVLGFAYIHPVPRSFRLPVHRGGQRLYP